MARENNNSDDAAKARRRAYKVWLLTIPEALELSRLQCQLALLGDGGDTEIGRTRANIARLELQIKINNLEHRVQELSNAWFREYEAMHSA